MFASRSLGAGSPASGISLIDSSVSRHRARLYVPDFGGVLGDGTIAGKPSGIGHIQDGLARPTLWVGVEVEQSVVRLEIRRKISQVHVVVAMRYQSISQRLEDACLMATEVVREDQIE